jgi:hypothetical protein
MRTPYVSAGQGGLQRATFHLQNSAFYGSRFPLSTSVQVKQRNALWVQRSVEVATFIPGEKRDLPPPGILQPGTYENKK